MKKILITSGLLFSFFLSAQTSKCAEIGMPDEILLKDIVPLAHISTLSAGTPEENNQVKSDIISPEFTNKDNTSAEDRNKVKSGNKQKSKTKKLFKRAHIQNTENDKDSQEPVNKDLLLPNVTPGQAEMGDINRSREYYNMLRNFGKYKDEADLDESLIQEELKLPERTIEDENTIQINNVTFSESAIFSEEELEKFKSLVENKDLTAEDINNYINLINTQYLKKNCITAKAYIPATELKGGTLHVELLEARIGRIIVENNKYNRTFFLKSRLTQKEGDVLNMMQLEKDLRKFNLNARGTKLTARLKAGEAYGTTDVIISPEEQFPVHFSGTWDNFGRTATGQLRGGAILSTDSVFGVQDRFTGAINFAHSSFTPYVDYNFPVNKQGTRLGASYMYGKSDVTRGDYKVWDLGSKIHVFSAYATHPLIQNERLSVNAIASVNRKMSNNDIRGFEYTKLNSSNLATGFNASYRFNSAYIYTSHIATNGIIEDRILGHDNYFAKYNGDLFGIKYFKNGIALTGKISGQYSPFDIPFIEQSQIGGMSTVRGYSESLMLGPSSYVTSIEVLFPIPILPKEIRLPFTKDRETRKYKTYAMRDNIRFATFVDHGAAFKHDQHVQNHDFLTSTGFGLRVGLSKYMTARFYWGWGIGTREINQKSGRFHFDIISSPF